MGKAIVLALLGVVLLRGIPSEICAGPSSGEAPLVYATDRGVYRLGDLVTITVTNRSNLPVAIVDRSEVDGGFATVEKREENGEWRAIELYAAANLTVLRPLAPDESHRYRWRTIGYNRADTIAPPGAYRVGFGGSAYTNLFQIEPR